MDVEDGEVRYSKYLTLAKTDPGISANPNMACSPIKGVLYYSIHKYTCTQNQIQPP